MGEGPPALSLPLSFFSVSRVADKCLRTVFTSATADAIAYYMRLITGIQSHNRRKRRFHLGGAEDVRTYAIALNFTLVSRAVCFWARKSREPALGTSFRLAEINSNYARICNSFWMLGALRTIINSITNRDGRRSPTVQLH